MEQLKKLESIFDSIGLSPNSFYSMSEEDILKELTEHFRTDTLFTILEDINSEDMSLDEVNKYLIDYGNEDIKREYSHLV